MLIIEIACGIVLGALLLANLDAVVTIVMLAISAVFCLAVVVGIGILAVNVPEVGGFIIAITTLTAVICGWVWLNTWLDRKGLDIDINFWSLKPVRIIRK